MNIFLIIFSLITHTLSVSALDDLNNEFIAEYGYKLNTLTSEYMGVSSTTNGPFFRDNNVRLGVYESPTQPCEPETVNPSEYFKRAEPKNTRYNTPTHSLNGVGDVTYWSYVPHISLYDAIEKPTYCQATSNTCKSFDIAMGTCTPPEKTYAFCSEKGDKRVAICIYQEEDNPEQAKQIFESFRWTNTEEISNASSSGPAIVSSSSRTSVAPLPPPVEQPQPTLPWYVRFWQWLWSWL